MTFISLPVVYGNAGRSLQMAGAAHPALHHRVLEGQLVGAARAQVEVRQVGVEDSLALLHAQLRRGAGNEAAQLVGQDHVDAVGPRSTLGVQYTAVIVQYSNEAAQPVGQDHVDPVGARSS